MEPQNKPSLTSLLRPYLGILTWLILFTLASNALNLLLPKIIASAIDAYTGNHLVLTTVIVEFFSASFFIFVFVYLQSIVQVYASERVARDLRKDVSAKISRQSYAYVQTTNPAKLLTNLTSDIDNIKSFVAQAIVSIVSSVFIIIGASILLLMIDWRLALAVLAIIPILGGTFFFVLSKVRKLFIKSREVIDWLNKVINESILGSALIRVLNSQQPEYEKFLGANNRAKDLGMQILIIFATMIPIISFVANLATVVILTLGGHFVIAGSMTLGNFTAFNSYLALLIFPILVIGFMSNVIAQAQASYGRVQEVLDTPEPKPDGVLKEKLRGDITVKGVTVMYGERPALKDVSLTVKAGTRTAIVGPTAAGKTQLLYVLTGLVQQNAGTVAYDGRDINEYDPESLHNQIGLVFQDSIMFNLSVRENIAFNTLVIDEALNKAIATAELKDFIDGLPEGLNTIVSERGGSLSGGQKQRIMLARALALNPRILLLDEFTARVDANTEQKTLRNIKENYPDITLVSVTQKIAAVEHYDQIIVIMEGEVLASGTHAELLKTSPEYVQIVDSQRSTNTYEEQSND
ncbi:MAG TPA: ABC transporter ATP-binding protein [Candidatus Paceibacterota bacterium]